MKELADIVLDYLLTDGAHHKQYALEVVLLHLVGQDEYERMKEEQEWEEGIA